LPEVEPPTPRKPLEVIFPEADEAIFERLGPGRAADKEPLASIFGGGETGVQSLRSQGI